MRSSQTEAMAAGLIGTSRLSDPFTWGRGLPAIPESRQLAVSIRPDNVKSLPKSASLTFQNIADDDIKQSRWASVPTKLDSQDKIERITKAPRKPRSSEDFPRTNDKILSLRAKVTRTNDSENSSPRANAKWDIPRHALIEKLTTHQPRLLDDNDSRLLDDNDSDGHVLLGLCKIVQDLAQSAPFPDLRGEGSPPAKKDKKNKAGPSPENVRIGRKTRLSSTIKRIPIEYTARFSCGSSTKKTALGPRCPIRQLSDPEKISDTLKSMHPLRKMKDESVRKQNNCSLTSCHTRKQCLGQG